MMSTAATLKRAAITNVNGAAVRTFTDVACRVRIAQLSASERALLGREGVEYTHKIYAPTSLTVVEQDEIWTGSATTVRYKVMGINDSQASVRSTHQELVVKRYEAHEA